MADQTLVKRLFWAMYATLLLSLFITACQDPTTSLEIRERGRDTIPTFHTDTVIKFHVDTVFVPVHDTTYVWCWEIDHNRDGHSAQYQCDNGYRGPLF